MAELKKYLVKTAQVADPSSYHCFVAVFQSASSSYVVYHAVALYGTDAFIGDTDTFRTESDALAHLDALVDGLCSNGYAIKWEAVDSNPRTVTWLDYKTRNRLDFPDPNWFVAPPTLTAAHSQLSDLEPVQTPLPVTKGEPIIKKRVKAPWNF